MTLHDPYELWAGLATITLLLLFFRWSWRKRAQLLEKYAPAKLLQYLDVETPVRSRLTRLAVLTLAVAALFFALSRPQGASHEEQTTQRGRDIFVAIDTSMSMYATDLPPNRLARAKLAALDLLKLSKSDRFGLIAFAGTAFVQCPLTVDEEAFRQSLSILDASIIPQGGTAIGEAIDSALASFKTDGSENNRIMVLLTDGEDHEEGAIENAKKAAAAGIRIFTVGVGTPAGDVLRTKDEQGHDVFLKDEEGNVVKSALNEKLLRDIASATDGSYLSLSDPQAMKTLYDTRLRNLPVSKFASRSIQARQELFHAPLAVAIILMASDSLWPLLRRRRRSSMMATLLLLLGLNNAHASPGKAQDAYAEGRYKDALNEYDRLAREKPSDARLRFNAGSAALAAKDFDRATKQLEAALGGTDPKLNQSTHYNLGLSQYGVGDGKSEPNEKIQSWERSISEFQHALELDPKDEDARANQALVKQRLEELKRQQQQQKKDDKNQDQNKDQKDKKDNKSDKKDQKDQQDKDNEQKKDDSDKDKDKDQQSQKSDEEKKQDQQKKQQQQQARDESKDPSKQPGEGQPKPINKQDGNKSDAARAEEAADAKAAAAGQMTEKQARQLLETQRGEEQSMVFMPAEKPAKPKGNRHFKNW